MSDIVIVGNGIAGHSAAAELLKRAPGKSVTVISNELGRPYDRPPLSKDFLRASGAAVPYLSPPNVYDHVYLRDASTAMEINRRDRCVLLSDGKSVRYNKLLLATGSRLRTLSSSPHRSERVFYLRTLPEARQLRSALLKSRSLVVIGGGFIGLEVAAAARQLGCTVQVLESTRRVVSRVASKTLASFVQALHSQRGVDLLFGAKVDDVHSNQSEVVVQSSVGKISADIAVVGVGVIPNVDLAEKCGLAVDDGIVVDERGCTSDPAIFAAGEVTNYPVASLRTRVRTESWSSAAAQAVIAARNMLGDEEAVFDELPWFWSDQYEVNIQCLGLMNQAKRIFQIGELSSNVSLRIGVDDAGMIVGAEGVNAGRDISALRRAHRARQPIPSRLLEAAVEELPMANSEPKGLLTS